MSQDLYPRHDSLRPPATRRGLRIRPAAVLSWIRDWRERRRRARVRETIAKLQEARRRMDLPAPMECETCGKPLLLALGPPWCSERCRLDAEIAELTRGLEIETTKGDTT